MAQCAARLNQILRYVESTNIPIVSRTANVIWNNGTYQSLMESLASGYAVVELTEIPAIFSVNSYKEFDTLHWLGERPVQERFLRELCNDDVVFDIGAAVGTYSIFSAQKGANVVAFEPFPENLKKIDTNAQLNNLNIDTRQVALADEKGTAQLSLHRESVGDAGHSLVRDYGKTIEVETKPGDELVKTGEVKQPNVIKIDVEGAEVEVIEGLKDTLQSPECTRIYIEIHDDTDPKALDLLNNVGFSLEMIYQHHGAEFYRGEK